jgi:YD repeat-containing protein
MTIAPTLIAVTDALNQATRLERKPDGEVVRIEHPDGTTGSFTYNALGQVLTHTDGEGQITRLLRTARGLPASRQDAKGQRISYEYDKALRLTALVNENNAAYRFAYDVLDRLIEEKRIDYLSTGVPVSSTLRMTADRSQKSGPIFTTRHFP